MRALSTPILVAAALLAAQPPADAADATAGNRVALRVGERTGRTDVGLGAPTRGRFRVRVSGRTAARRAGSFGLRVGELAFDVTLTDGRYSGQADGDAGPVTVRVLSRGGSLTATVTGRVPLGSGTVLGQRCLDGVDSDDFRRAGNFHGLVGASAVVDGATVPLAVGFTGWSSARVLPTGEVKVDLGLSAASVAPVERATRPMLLLAPPRPGGGWNGRVQGIAFATGAPPRLSFELAGGSTLPIAAPDDARGEFGDAETQAPGVSVLVLPEGAVFQRAFDVAVQAPLGPQRVTFHAVGPQGARTDAARGFAPPAPDPPSLLDADFHVLEVRAGGALWASGVNFTGAVGDGTLRDPLSPVPLTAPRGVVSVGAGDGFSIAADATGAVWAWGDIGDPDGYSPFPSRVPGLAGIVSVSAGTDDALALDAAGGVWLWEYDRPRFRPVRGVPPAVEVAAGDGAAVALDAHGDVWDLRATDEAGKLSPARVVGLPFIRSVAAGDEALFLDEEGGVWRWTQSSGASFVRVALPSPATAVSAGYQYSLALLDDGTAWAWSPAEATSAGIVAVRVRDLERITRIAAGTGATSFALDQDGFLWKWETFDVEVGGERPTLAPRAFRAGHKPIGTASFDAARRR